MADTKNFGLVGVGSKVQFGKAGPSLVSNAGHFEAQDTLGNLTTVKGANGVQATDLVTLAQLNYVANVAAQTANSVASQDGFHIPLGNAAAYGENYIPGAVPLTDTTVVSDAIVDLNRILSKLVPSAPANFPNGALSVTNGSGNTPLLASGGVTDNTAGGTGLPAAGAAVTRITSTVNTNTFTQVGPGNAGTISVLVNGASVSSKTLTDTTATGAGDNGSVTGGLVISGQAAFPTDTPGFWKSINVGVTGAAATQGINRISITDTAASSTNDVLFVKDNNTSTPVLSAMSLAQNALGTVAYSSGVPHYNTGASLTVGASVANLAGETYYGGASPLTITGANAIIASQTYTYATQGISTPIARQTLSAVAITPVTVSINSTNKFAVGQIQAAATNVNGSSAASTVAATNILVMIGNDSTKLYEMNVPVANNLGTGSGNAVRVTFPTGDTPAGTSTAFSSSAALATYEAALVAGVLKADQTNYSTGYLPVGPDYSGHTATQYVTFAFQRSAASKFTINVTGTYAGCWVQLPGVSTDTGISPNAANGWWNMYQPYSGAGVPGRAGDPNAGCALGSVMNGTTNTFVATFGTQSSTNSTGNTIYVRFKLNAGQSITALQFQQ